MMVRLSAHIALTMIVLLGVAVLPTAVHAASYSYQLDRFEINGNDPGVFVDEFSDGDLSPWIVSGGTASESGDVVTLEDPGWFDLSSQPGLPVEMERSDILLHGPGSVSNDGGDFTATSTWDVTDFGVNQVISMSLNWQHSPTTQRNIHVEIGNADPEVAALLGIPTGLIAAAYASEYLIDYGGIGSGLVGEGEAVALDPADITGAVLLRLAFDDSTNALTPWYSLDGGGTFHSPFAPMTMTFDDGFVAWGIDVRHYTIIPEPTTALLLAAGLAGLAAAGRRRSLH